MDIKLSTLMNKIIYKSIPMTKIRNLYKHFPYFLTTKPIYRINRGTKAIVLWGGQDKNRKS